MKNNVKRYKRLLNKIWFFIKDNKNAFIASLATTIAVLFFFIVRGIAPFGEDSLLTMDLWGQYYPMIVDRLRHPFNTWSWNGSLGYNEMIQSYYYANSLFNFLLLPFSGYSKIAALDMMILFKIALSSFNFAYLIDHRRDIKNILSIPFAVAYGLSAYTVAFISQPMWLDSMLFLPLIILSLENIVNKKKNPLTFILFLSLTIYSNFYTAYMVCLFVVLYFICLLIGRIKKDSLKEIFITTVKFGVSSLISGALVAFAIIPLYYSMNNWISSSLGFDTTIEFYHKISLVINNFSFAATPSLEFGPANVWASSASIFLFALYLLNPKIKLKKKIPFGIFLSFLFISFDLNILDYIWHGLHFPNQLPARQSFLFIFLILLLSLESLEEKDGINVFNTTISFILSTIFMIHKITESTEIINRSTSILIVTIIFVILLIYYFNRKKEGIFNYTKIVITVVITIECMLSSAISMSLNLSSATAKGFVTFDEDMQYVVEKYESKSDDFYRTEMDGAWTFNPGMLFGYKGVSYYSSTMNGNSYEFFKNQGISVYALNVSTVYFTDFLKDSLFGIKYIYARGEGSIPILYNEIEKHGYITVYENPYNLGVAFLVDDDVLSYKSTDYLKSDATSKFFKLASGENDNILSFIKYDLRSNTNSSFYIQNGNTYFSCPDTTKPAKFTYTFNIYDTDDYNLNFNFRVGNYEIYVNDNLVNTGTITGKGENIGSLNEGDKVRIEVSITGYSIALEGVSLVKINYDALNSTFNKLKSGTLNVTYSSNTKIEGTINVSEKSTLLSSIPAENGWNVYVDGIKKEIIKFDNTLIAISIEPGEHTIEYKYNTPGLKLGIIISSISFISISLYYFLDLKKRRTL